MQLAVRLSVLCAHREPKANVACITFGAPLVGDRALRKLVLDSGWDGRMHQVVWRHDMVPRILLSPGTCATLFFLQDFLLHVWDMSWLMLHCAISISLARVQVF